MAWGTDHDGASSLGEINRPLNCVVVIVIDRILHTITAYLVLLLYVATSRGRSPLSLENGGPIKAY